MDAQFTDVPEWLRGPIATMAAIMVLISIVSLILMLVTNNMQLKKVQLKLPQLEIMSRMSRWFKTTPAEEEPDLEQGLAGEKTQKRRKRRARKPLSQMFLLGSESQSDEEDVENGPYDLSDSAWLAPAQFIGDKTEGSLSPRSDVFSMDDDRWCSVPVTV